ncbi:hypothetical protein [Eubacterium sp.]|uniref:phage tail protein n=1 Tax=Eubacterium sp. TaxID=142586 RepID=UPI0026DED50A|nr:hypothetical protein [Eubacterium sp.]MDO5432965.1 hypothetical protein [Eubacterium sp.]
MGQASGNKLVIEVDLDNMEFKKGLDDMDKETSKWSGKLSKLGGVAAKGFTVAAAGVAAVGGAMATAGGYSIKLASDLTEVQNVVDVTFGDDASKINKWAKDAATSFGMAELDAKQFNGTMGAMLKSMGLSGGEVTKMSTDMVGLAGDMASFYNLDHEEAFEKIRSGISGETEPLKQLGINMSVANLEAFALSKGMDKSYNSMTQAEQATLRYQYLMSVTADAQGDFARTSDSLANQLRIAQLQMTNLAGSVGQELLPAATEAVKFLGEMGQRLNNAFSAGGMEGLVSEVGSVLAEIVTKITEYLPKIIDVGVSVIKSLVQGLVENAPQILEGVMAILNALSEGILQILPSLLELGLQIVIGLIQGIGESLPSLIPMIVETLLSMVNIILENIPLFIQTGLQLLVGLFQGIVNALPVIIEQLPTIIQNILQMVLAALPLFIEAGIQLFTALVQAMPTIIQNIIMVLPTIIGSIITAVIQLLPLIVDAGIQLFLALIDAMPYIIETIVSELPTIIAAIIQAIIDNLPLIINAGIDLFLALIKALPTIIVGIVGAVPKIIGGIVRGFTDGIGQIAEVGKNLIHGLWDGIMGAGQWLYDKVAGFASGILDNMKAALGIHSPSKRAEDEIGKMIPPGIGVGVTVNKDKAMKAIDDLSADMFERISGTVSANSRASAGGLMERGIQSVQRDNPTINVSAPDPAPITVVAETPPIYLDTEKIADKTTPRVVSNVSREKVSKNIAKGKKPANV